MGELRYAIALTGSIGSGKSTLVSFLSLYGYESICGDSIAHKVLDENAVEVIEAFGDFIVGENGKINRKKLGKIIFSSSKEREKLQNILHSPIQAEILAQAWWLEEKGVWYFLDIPLFFEVGGKEAYPVARSLVVYTPKDKAIARIIKRDNLSLDEATARLDAQMPIEEKCRLADDIIGNDGDLRSLQQRLESYLQSLPSYRR